MEFRKGKNENGLKQRRLPNKIETASFRICREIISLRPVLQRQLQALQQ
jgi:hypothetical protein